VDITWLGHAATRVRTRQAAVVMDPTDKSAGNDMSRPTGEVVTISRNHPHHSYAKGVKGDPFIVDGPGEYEILGTQFIGIRAFLPADEGETPVATTLYVCRAEDMRLVHLGGLGQAPTPQQSQELADSDVLIIPIALPGGLDPKAAAKIARALEPKIVVPVGYPPSSNGHSDELKVFLEGIGAEPEEPVSRFTVQRRNVGDGHRVVLLESRG
jgi:L-ascorbate metabolism protein UlaG (beta-lactamase superfamily)